MSYRANSKGHYGIQNRKNQRTWIKTTRKKKLDGFGIKETEKVEFSNLPSEFTQENSASGSIGITNGVLGANGSLAKRKIATTKFPEKTDS